MVRRCGYEKVSPSFSSVLNALNISLGSAFPDERPFTKKDKDCTFFSRRRNALRSLIKASALALPSTLPNQLFNAPSALAIMRPFSFKS